MENNDCDNCKHKLCSIMAEPCLSCSDVGKPVYWNWEPDGETVAEIPKDETPIEKMIREEMGGMS